MNRIPASIRTLLVVLSLVSVCCAQIDLQKADASDLVRMLKFIRSPEFSGAVPVILPLLHNSNENVVRDTCRTLAVIGSSNVIPAIEPLLTDKRADVRADAQNALLVLRGEGGKKYPSSSILDSFNGSPDNAVEILKLIRGPEFAAAVPSIIPLLNHPDEHIVRDSCRTLAVIADKSVIRFIQPLTSSRHKAIRLDAENAIAKLEAKP